MFYFAVLIRTEIVLLKCVYKTKVQPGMSNRTDMFCNKLLKIHKHGLQCYE